MLKAGVCVPRDLSRYRTANQIWRLASPVRTKLFSSPVSNAMITNVASAVFMFPIGMAMAGSLGLNGMPFAITVMVGASCSFISPMGYQTNLMVYGPGGYKFTDFVKIGIPMTVVVGIITIILAPMVWPF